MPFRPARRLEALPAYLFAELERRKQAARAGGRDVIDLAIGDPDRPTGGYIRAAMQRAVADPANDRYPAGAGCRELREAIAAFFQQRYGVALDPRREILALIGTKEGLGHLPLALADPGRTVLVPEPGYPVYRAAALLAGARPWTVPLRRERGWLPELEAIPPAVSDAAAVMYLNYPNNPTGALAGPEFFARAVAFARRRELLIAHDAAYNEVYFDEPPPSILQVPGAKAVAVEFHSLSKTFNMTGWRLGFVAGNAAALDALARVKDNLDSGPCAAVQRAGAAAYAEFERAGLDRMRAVYRQRAATLCRGLTALGFGVCRPRATFYVWARAPAGCDSLRLARRLLEEAAVACAPGAAFGRGGEGYLRFALTVPDERIRQALARLGELRW